MNYSDDFNQGAKDPTQIVSHENLHFNSKFRENYYNTSASEFSIKGIDRSKVKTLKLSSISIPNSWYTFSHANKTNRFFIELSGNFSESTGLNHNVLLRNFHEIVIEDGNYDVASLEHYLNTNYFYESDNDTPLKYLKFSISRASLRSRFEFIETSPFDATMRIRFVAESSNVNNIMKTAGWILGFRYAEYRNVSSYIMSEGLYDGGGDRYFYFVLNDYSTPKEKNIVYLYDTTLVESNILAKIYLIDGKFSINIESTPDDASNFVKSRTYDTPQRIDRIDVKLVDQYGDLILLNNMDFSFTLELGITE